MTELVSDLLCGLLGFATGIFTVLSLVEKPVWALMRDRGAPGVGDGEARAVHAILKRVIHLLPPAMITTMAAVSALVVVQLFRLDLAPGAIAVAAVFFVQLALVLVPLFPAIRGVDGVPSDGDIGSVRGGLGTLARVHHQGLAMAGTTLAAQWVLAGS